MIAESEEVCVEDLIDEIAMGPFGSNIKTDCFVNSGIPVFNGSNLTGFETNDTALRYVTPEKANSLGNALASRGDIVITHRGTLGQVAMVPYDSKYPRYVISQSQFRIRCNDKVLPKFFVYYFHTREGQWRLLSNKTQTGVPALGRPTSTFRKLSMPLPTFEKQAKIVQVIDTIQKKIKNNSKLNGYLEELADGMFRRHFGGLTDNATLADFANVTMGQSPAGSSYNETGIGTIFYQGRAEFGWRYPTQRLSTTEPKRMAKAGDVLMSVRAPVGDLNLAYEDCCIGRGLAAIHCDYPSYGLYLMRSLHKKLDAYNGEGTVFGSINGKALNGLPIALPNNAAIRAFEKEATPIDTQIRNNEVESRALVTLRDTLLPKLMSGEIDVSKVDLTQLNSHLA